MVLEMNKTRKNEGDEDDDECLNDVPDEDDLDTAGISSMLSGIKK
jgi:hypothetical protein